MKTKFFLVLIALNGLFLGANSASAATTATIESNQNATVLSNTISELIDLDANTYSLVESAINRALIAKNVNQQQNNNFQRPLINGIIIKDRPILINGTVLKKPNLSKPIIKQPLINGVIEKPIQR